MGKTIGATPQRRKRTIDPDTWETPPEEIAFVRACFGGSIGLDPCAGTSRFSQCHAEVNYTWRDDGLTSVWWGTVFMNPQYSCLSTWCETAVRWSEQSCAVIGLLPAYTGPNWWHDYVGRAIEVALLPKRISFIDPTTGERVRGTSFDSAYALWDRDERVADRFRYHALARGAMVFRPRTLRAEGRKLLAQQHLFQRHS